MHSFNSALYYLSGGNWIEVARCKKIDGPDEKPTSVETSHLRSTSKTKTFIPGFKDPGNVKTETISDSAQYAALKAMYDAGTVTSWRVVDPDGATDQGEGFIDNLSKGIPEDGNIMCSLSVKATGVWTYTA